MTFRITHVDFHGRRHQIEVQSATRSGAEQVALMVYGAARYMAAVCLRRRAP